MYLPIIQQKDYDSLLQFQKFIKLNSSRELSKISLNFHHKVFNDNNKGFAVMSSIARTSPIMDVFYKKLIEITDELVEQYENEIKIGN